MASTILASSALRKRTFAQWPCQTRAPQGSLRPMISSLLLRLLWPAPGASPGPLLRRDVSRSPLLSSPLYLVTEGLVTNAFNDAGKLSEIRNGDDRGIGSAVHSGAVEPNPMQSRLGSAEIIRFQTVANVDHLVR